MKKTTKSIVDIIFSIIIITGFIWMYMEYDNFINSDFKPSGKAGKVGLIIINFLDRIGGKIFTIATLIILTLPYLIKTFKKVFFTTFRRKADKEDE